MSFDRQHHILDLNSTCTAVTMERTSMQAPLSPTITCSHAVDDHSFPSVPHPPMPFSPFTEQPRTEYSETSTRHDCNSRWRRHWRTKPCVRASQYIYVWVATACKKNQVTAITSQSK
jgi:hypothetical protein